MLQIGFCESATWEVSGPMIRNKVATDCPILRIVERGCSAVECRTRNLESPGSNPFATVSKYGHLYYLHDSAV